MLYQKRTIWMNLKRVMSKINKNMKYVRKHNVVSPSFSVFPGYLRILHCINYFFSLIFDWWCQLHFWLCYVPGPHSEWLSSVCSHPVVCLKVFLHFSCRYIDDIPIT
jgi:hypothetical protein